LPQLIEGGLQSGRCKVDERADLGRDEPRVRVHQMDRLGREREGLEHGPSSAGRMAKVTFACIYRACVERDITADMRGESFLGTDFNYEDLGLQSLDFQSQSIGGGKDSEGRDCYQLESVPQSGWWYGRIVRCVDRKTYLPLRTEYYDRTGVLWKIRTLEGVKTIHSHPTATHHDATVPTKTSTRITLRNVAYDTGLADVLFEGP
jgi:hypothetical protein